MLAREFYTVHLNSDLIMCELEVSNGRNILPVLLLCNCTAIINYNDNHKNFYHNLRNKSSQIEPQSPEIIVMLAMALKSEAALLARP